MVEMAPDAQADSHSAGGRFTATFRFRQKARDAEFDRLDALIATAAEENPGYRGRKKWHDKDGNLAVVYYWDSLEALETFAAHPTHQEAKSQYDRWYEGYRIEIAQVLRTYGDGYYDSQDEP